MTDAKVPEALKDALLDIVNNAEWYWECSGTQSEHHTELSLEEHHIETRDEDRVVEQIVEAVLKEFYSDDKIIQKVRRAYIEECELVKTTTRNDGRKRFLADLLGIGNGSGLSDAGHIWHLSKEVEG